MKDGVSFMMKECNSCREEKSVEDFYKASRSPDKLQYACKQCTRERDRGPRREQRREYAWKRKLMLDFDMAPEDYWEMFEQQDGACAICRAEPDWKRLAVDHDHETGEVRGLLCNSCNCGIGFFKESPALISAALGYLKA